MNPTKRLPSGRRFSKLLYVYVLRNYLFVLACCICTFLTLFLVGALVDDLEDFLRYKAGLAKTLRYFLYLQPDHFGYVLPISLLMATMYVVAGLCRHGEITAIRASGISILQFGLPLWTFAVAAAVIHGVVTEYAAPYCRQSAEQIYKSIKDPYRKHRESEARAYLAYRNRHDHRAWFFGNFSREGPCREISITQFRPDGTTAWELYADEAVYGDDGWVMKSAVRRWFDNDGYLPVGDVENSEILPMPALGENPKTFVFLFSLRPMEQLSALKIRRILATQNDALSESTRATMESFLFFYACSPLACVIAVLLGVPLSITHERHASLANFVKGFAIMATYYLLQQACLIMGKSQVIPSYAVGFVPFVAALAVGIREIRRISR